MMRSMLHALTWEYFARAAWVIQAMLAVSLSLTIVYVSISSLLPGGVGANAQLQQLLEVALLPTVIFLIMTGAGAGLWPTSRLYAKPISNLSITAWVIGGGCVMLLAQLPLVIWCYNRYFDAGWPLLGAVLFSLTFWAMAQPFFIVGTRSVSWMLITSVPIILIGSWFMSRYGVGMGQRHDWTVVSPLEMLTLAMGFVLGTITTHWVVVRDRCGQCQANDALWVLQQLTHWLDQRSKDRPAYRSAAAAHFWYLWPIKGVVMVPAMGLLMLMVLSAFAVRSALGLTNIDELQRSMAALPISFPLLFVLYGLILGIDVQPTAVSAGRGSEGRGRARDQLGSFFGSLPITDASLARVYMTVCAVGIVLTYLFWLVSYSLMILVVGSTRGWIPWLPDSLSVSIYVVIVALSWMLASNCMTLVCIGRSQLWLGLAGGSIFAYSVGVGVIYSFASQSVVQAIHVICLGVLAIGLAVLTVDCYRQAWRRSYIGWQSTLIAVATSIATFWVSTQLQDRPLTEHWQLSLICSLLMILPWSAMPLAISSNRHR